LHGLRPRHRFLSLPAAIMSPPQAMREQRSIFEPNWTFHQPSSSPRNETEKTDLNHRSSRHIRRSTLSTLKALGHCKSLTSKTHRKFIQDLANFDANAPEMEIINLDGPKSPKLEGSKPKPQIDVTTMHHQHESTEIAPDTQTTPSAHRYRGHHHQHNKSTEGPSAAQAGTTKHHKENKSSEGPSTTRGSTKHHHHAHHHYHSTKGPRQSIVEKCAELGIKHEWPWASESDNQYNPATASPDEGPLGEPWGDTAVRKHVAPKPVAPEPGVAESVISELAVPENKQQREKANIQPRRLLKPSPKRKPPVPASQTLNDSDLLERGGNNALEKIENRKKRFCSKAALAWYVIVGTSVMLILGLIIGIVLGVEAVKDKDKEGVVSAHSSPGIETDSVQTSSLPAPSLPAPSPLLPLIVIPT
jgi:hypothetical protein